MNHRKIFRRMSTGIAILGMALCVPTALLAQDAPPPPNQGAMQPRGPVSPEMQLKRLTKTLNLTSDQQQQMLPILQDQQKKMESIQSDSSLAPQDRRQQMMASRMDTNQKLEAIMTDSQKQQYEQEMQQRRQHMGGMGQGGPGGPGGNGAPPPPPPQQ